MQSDDRVFKPKALLYMSWLQVRVVGKLKLTNNSFITINLRAQSS